MKQSTQHSLGGFEQRLLRELRQVVADNSPSAPAERETVARPARLGRGLRIGLAAGAAAAAAIAVVSALSIGGGGGSKAWAVSRNPDGTVTVQIKSLADADGLQRKLAEAGIRSLVQYLPPGKTCAGGELSPPPGAVTQTKGDPSAPGPAGAHGQEYGFSTGGGQGADAGPVTQSSGTPPSGDRPGISGNVDPSISGYLGVKTSADGSVYFTVSPAARSDETLVIRSQGSAPGQAADQTQGPSTISVNQVQGQAQPCKVVDSPAQ
jgi:hypothetical protein